MTTVVVLDECIPTVRQGDLDLRDGYDFTPGNIGRVYQRQLSKSMISILNGLEVKNLTETILLIKYMCSIFITFWPSDQHIYFFAAFCDGDIIHPPGYVHFK